MRATRERRNILSMLGISGEDDAGNLARTVPGRLPTAHRLLRVRFVRRNNTFQIAFFAVQANLLRREDIVLRLAILEAGGPETQHRHRARVQRDCAARACSSLVLAEFE